MRLRRRRPEAAVALKAAVKPADEWPTAERLAAAYRAQLDDAVLCITSLVLSYAAGEAHIPVKHLEELDRYDLTVTQDPDGNRVLKAIRR